MSELEKLLTNLEEYMTLWDAVCDEQDANDYNWDLTRSKLLPDWGITDSVDFFSGYMTSTIIDCCRDIVRARKSTSAQRH